MKGTLLGFTWNNIHSSALGLIRVSNGSEFSEELLPSFTDKSIEKPGADGKYYYGTIYNTKTITINTAFNGLTDAQLRSIKVLFADRVLNNLTLDELPYKSFRVRLASPPSFSYNAFTENYDDDDWILPHNHQLGANSALPTFTALDKVYRGMITFLFIAYEPFGFSRTVYEPQSSTYVKLKYNNQFLNSAYVPEWKIDPLAGPATSNLDYNLYNFNEWSGSINLHNKGDQLTTGGATYYLDTPSTTGVAIYNAGDMETPFTLVYNINYSRAQKDANNRIVLDGFSLVTDWNPGTMIVAPFTLGVNETKLRWNGKLQLLEGLYADGSPSGRIYNRYITSGSFFNIPCSNLNVSEGLSALKFAFGASFLGAIDSIDIDYDYRFF